MMFWEDRCAAWGRVLIFEQNIGKKTIMKKLMVMLAAVAMAACAQANVVKSYITVYEKDSNPADANASWYSCYFMTADAITTATGGSVDSVDAAAYAEWLQTNFADNKAATTSNASLVMPTSDSGYASQYNQYGFKYEVPPEQDKAFLAVCFFDNDTDHAFKIAKKTSQFYAFDDQECQGTGWTAAPSTEAIPEPTSGLMLLLGLAGLALKRKAV